MGEVYNAGVLNRLVINAPNQLEAAQKLFEWVRDNPDKTVDLVKMEQRLQHRKQIVVLWETLVFWHPKPQD